MTKLGNGHSDWNSHRGGARGGMYVERECIPVKCLGLRNSNRENMRLSRSESNICDQGKFDSLEQDRDKWCIPQSQVRWILTASRSCGDGERAVTVHQLVDRHLNPTPSASPNAVPSTKSGVTSWEVWRLRFVGGYSKRTLTDMLSVGASEPTSLGSPNNLI